MKENGINQTILKEVSDQYIQMNHMVQQTIKEHPEGMEKLVKAISQNMVENQQISLGNEDANMDRAHIFMRCLPWYVSTEVFWDFRVPSMLRRTCRILRPEKQFLRQIS